MWCCGGLLGCWFVWGNLVYDFVFVEIVLDVLVFVWCWVCDLFLVLKEGENLLF